MFAEMKSRAQLAELAMRCAQSGAGHIRPLIYSAMALETRFAIVSPEGRMPLRILNMDLDRRPLIVVLGGDLDPVPGPVDFPQSNRLLQWAGFVLVHAAGGEAPHYQIAVEAAKLRRRVLLIETNTAGQRAWMEAKDRIAPRTPGLVIEVPQGQPPHPQERAPAGVVLQ